MTFSRLFRTGTVLTCSFLFFHTLAAGLSCGSYQLGAVPKPKACQRFLLIEAEDLGVADSIDRAAFTAMDQGWVRSADVLTSAPWFPEVVQWARSHPDFDFGIRLDLTSEWATYKWRPISQTPALADKEGYLWSNPRDVLRHATTTDVASEIKSQVEIARQAGFHFSHLDQRILVATPSLFGVYLTLGRSIGIVVTVSRAFVRSHCVSDAMSYMFNCGGIDVDLRTLPIDQELEIMPGFAKKDWLSAYENALRPLPPGTYMLRVHLGFSNEELKAMTAGHPNWGAEWRQNDYDVISSPEFRKRHFEAT